MLIVGTDKTAVEADLIGGRLSCPICQVGLRPWGHGVDREVRLMAHSEQRCFRRSICRPCRATHVLIPEDTLVRRRHAGEVIGAALTAKAKELATDGSPKISAWHRQRCADGCGPSTSRQWFCENTSFVGPTPSIPDMTTFLRVVRTFVTPSRPSACSPSWRSAASGRARRGHSPLSSPAAPCFATRTHTSASPCERQRSSLRPHRGGTDP